MSTTRTRARLLLTSLLEGPSPETCRRRSGEWRPAVAARNRRPREARDPARQALRPGCEELALRIRRKCRRRKRGPRPKIATVERREATTENLRLSALRSPLTGVDGTEKSKTRAQQRAAGTKKTALLDMVNRNIAATRSVPAERAKRRAVTHHSRVPAKRGPGGSPGTRERIGHFALMRAFSITAFHLGTSSAMRLAK